MDDLIANLIVIPTQGRLRNWLAAIDGANPTNPGAEKFRCMVGGLRDAMHVYALQSRIGAADKRKNNEGGRILLRKQLLESVMGCCLFGIGDRNWRCWIVFLNN